MAAILESVEHVNKTQCVVVLLINGSKRRTVDTQCPCGSGLAREEARPDTEAFRVKSNRLTAINLAAENDRRGRLLHTIHTPDLIQQLIQLLRRISP